MNEFHKVKEKMDKTLTPETCLHRVLVMGMMNEIPIYSKEPKGGKARFLQDAERNAAYFWKFKARYFMYMGPGSEKTQNFKKYPDSTQGTWDELAKPVTDVFLVPHHSILTGCINFQKGKLKRGGENMHFSASDPSVNMMMDLIFSANEFRNVFGVCDYLGKINEMDFES